MQQMQVEISMAKSSIDNLSHSIQFYTRIAIASVILLLCSIGVWAVFTEISGAVIASGSIVVDGNSKQIQHREGGIVEKVLVENGQEVFEGDVLILLDDTIVKSNLDAITKQLDSLYARKDRLIAEQSGKDDFEFARQFNDKKVIDPNLREIQISERKLFFSRQNALLGKKKQLNEQIFQFEQEINGLEFQIKSTNDEVELIQTELSDLERLLTQQLVGSSRVVVLKRDKVKLEGELGSFVSQIARIRKTISERKLQILELEESFIADVLTILQETRSEIASLEEQKIAAKNQLERIEIKAPKSGVVHDLSVHTTGQVLAPAELTMLIVPKDGQLVVEAKIPPVNIDQIYSGQRAKIMLPSFDQRTTPELFAKVQTISADLILDPLTGLKHYIVTLIIPENELTKLGGKQLVPGMPVETFLQTSERTVLAYLLKPISDQIKHAMRER